MFKTKVGFTISCLKQQISLLSNHTVQTGTYITKLMYCSRQLTANPFQHHVCFSLVHNYDAYYIEQRSFQLYTHHNVYNYFSKSDIYRSHVKHKINVSVSIIVCTEEYFCLSTARQQFKLPACIFFVTSVTCGYDMLIFHLCFSQFEEKKTLNIINIYAM